MKSPVRIAHHRRRLLGTLLLMQLVTPAFAADEMPDVVGKIVKVYLAHRHADESFLDTLDRIGIDPFKNRVYEGRAHGTAKAAEKEAA